MDKVQFQLEATLPELKDLYEKGLFTKSEINHITKKRTAFETSLIRRVTRKEDFFKYAEYEINLERLRKVRWKKLKYHLNPPPPSASTYSLPRRTLYILKRATVKFPGDLATWLAYVEYASREGMRKVVGKGLTNALQHHPTSSTLYLLQTYYHLHPASPFPRESIPSTSKLDLPSATSNEPPAFAIEGIDPARTTLLIGLRLLPQSIDLWREYVKLELGWVEALRRRWKLLGIKEGEEVIPEEGFEGDQEALKGGEGAFGPEGEDARKSILAGQLVIHALNSSLESVPSSSENGMEYRKGLLNMLRKYPSPLRTKCLSVIYEESESISQGDDAVAAEARLLILVKGLYDRPYDPEHNSLAEGDIVLSGVELVEELGKIGKEIRKSVKSNKGNKAWLESAGLWLIGQIRRFDDNVELREYLSTILASLTKPSLQPPVTLLLAHLALLSSSAPDVSIARSYATIYPTNPSIQLYHLSAETHHSTDVDFICKICEEAARTVTVSNLSDDDREQVRSIWKLWLDWENAQVTRDAEADEKRWKSILKESMKSGANIPGLHSDIVGYYIISCLKSRQSVHDILSKVKGYQPTFNTFNIVFKGLNVPEIKVDSIDLKKMYTAWRSVCKTPYEKAQAVLSYAAVLLGTRGKGREAFDVIEVVKREVREDEDVERFLEKEWKALIDGDNEDKDEDEEMSEE
ncbi:uncharacterized protein IL334_004369 [Kwoniella shivajii]|uniref:U3 small nucleolar RNA-associated protein 6 N-terminal domain-containing protein n=1 Tax=Kwoniella shivajii TaxID=564305 RepID=A0ABZ1D099_9TREE|nr:hypothetical protein IL334_004369 [Kwoniella shivajii]